MSVVVGGQRGGGQQSLPRLPKHSVSQFLSMFPPQPTAGVAAPRNPGVVKSPTGCMNGSASTFLAANQAPTTLICMAAPIFLVAKADLCSAFFLRLMFRLLHCRLLRRKSSQMRLWHVHPHPPHLAQPLLIISTTGTFPPTASKCSPLRRPIS